MKSITNESSTTKNGSKMYGKVILMSKNCQLTEEKLSETPSRIDGLDSDSEIDLRIYGCELIQIAGILLKLPQVAMATGQVLLQRFYYSKSMVRHPIEHTAMACIHLASKIEETPRRIRDVINVFNYIRQVSFNKPILPVILDKDYINLKMQVIKAERRVLKELGFSVHIKHPHKIIVMYLQVLSHEKNQEMVQMSWNYMNDALRTDVFVRYQPEVIASACIYLTARKLQIPLPKSPAWYSVFSVNENEINDVCSKILRLYNRQKPDVETLEKKIVELCKKYQERKVSSPVKKVSGAQNAWGGFISRFGDHLAQTTEKFDKPDKPSRSKSKSQSHSPVKRRRSKKHARSRSLSPKAYKKSHKRYSRSRSNSPRYRHTKKSSKTKHRSISRGKRSSSFDREKHYKERYDKYERDRYDRDKYDYDKYDYDKYDTSHKKDKYSEKTDKKEGYSKGDESDNKHDKYSDKYSKEDTEKDKYKK